MPGKCHFQNIWLEDDQYRLWLRSASDVYSAFCSLCKKTFDVSHSGITSIKSHMSGKKHAQIENNLKSGKQITLHSFIPKPTKTIESSQPLIVASTSSTHDSLPNNIVKFERNDAGTSGLSSFLVPDTITRAEILWAAHCVVTNTSSRSGGLATDLFKLMFPDSAIAQKLQMHKDKIAYSVTYGLGPFFSKSVSSEANKSPFFALSVDESLNDVCQKQQMDIMINYWNSDEDCVNTRYLTSVFLERSTAVNLLQKILSAVAECNLSLDNLVQLCTDGPNVNIKLVADLKAHMKETLSNNKEILDIGTCSLHIVNGAYKTAHNKVSWKVNQFLRAAYRLFKNYPSRRAVYTEITGSKLFPKKFCSVRWTENSSVIRRCLDIMPDLKKYVDNIVDPPASENFSIIQSFLRDTRILEARLHFSAMISEELEEFLTCFQNNKPLLPFLHQELFALMKSLAEKFIKKQEMAKITTATKLRRIDLGNIDNFLALDNINIGFGARHALRNVKEVDAQIFKLNCKEFLAEMFKKLMEKSPLNKKMVLGASSLNPMVMASETLRSSRAKVAIEELVVHSQMSPAEGDITLREYNKFCENPAVQEHLKSFNWKKDKLDTFFTLLFNLPSNQSMEYRKLKLFVHRILICFHGNAAVERSFSFNKNFLVENLQEKSLVAQRSLHDHVRSLPDGLSSLVINKQMMNEFRCASSRRKEDLKRKKDEEDEEINAQKKAAIEMKKLKLMKQKLLEEKDQEISNIEQKMKTLKKQL